MKFWQKQHRGLCLLTAIDVMRANPDLYDFEVRFCGQTFHAHRVVLMASSGYFRDILQKDMELTMQGYVELYGMDIESVKSCLEYLYTGKISITFETIKATLGTCHHLQIYEIQELCFDFLRSSLSANNCLQILHYSAEYHSDITMNAVVAFFAKNFKKIIQTPAYLETDDDIVVELIRTAGAPTTLVLWHAITSWIEYDPSTRKHQLSRFLKEIKRFDLKPTLDSIIRHPLVIKDREATEYIVQDVLFGRWSEFREYVNDDNIFLAYQWTQLYNFDIKSEIFRSLVFEYLQCHFTKLYRHQDFVSVTLDDFLALLNSEEVTSLCQMIRWRAIVRWIDEIPSRESHFENLFLMVDLKTVAASFIQKEVRCYRLVQNSSKCKDLLMDTMFHQTQTKIKINSCLLFDKTSGDLHYHHNDNWVSIGSDERLVGGTLIGGGGEAFVFNSPSFYKIRSNGRIEVKEPCPESNKVATAVIHSGKLFVFYEDLRQWIFDLYEGKWVLRMRDFDIPTDTSSCSTKEGIIFLGGGVDGKFTKLYDPNSYWRSARRISPMLYRRRDASSASVGNMVFLVGGEPLDVSQQKQPPVEIYCMRTNKWSFFTLPIMHFTDNCICCCEADIGVYVVGHGTPMNSFGERSSLQIRNFPNWTSTDLDGMPQVKIPEIASWICLDTAIGRSTLSRPDCESSRNLHGRLGVGGCQAGRRSRIKFVRRKLRK